MRTKMATSFRLSEKVLTDIRSLSQEIGISQADVIVLAIRNLAKREGVDVEGNENRIRSSGDAQ